MHTIYAVKHPTTQALVWVKRGEVGFWPADAIAADIGAWNEKQGITPAQAEAALTGSMFGWDAPGARAA